MAFVAQSVTNLPAVQETRVRSLAWEDPLEEGMATHSSILAWRIPMDRGAWQATVSPLCHKESDTTERLTHTHTITGIFSMHHHQLLSLCALGPLLCSKRNYCDEKPTAHSWRVAPARHNQRKPQAATETPPSPK